MDTATKKTETPNLSPMNVYAKLLAVRSEFYENGAKKTGKNLHAEFMYFELEDIVPAVAPLFTKYGLLMKPSFTENTAEAHIINVDNPDQELVFSIPLQFIAEPAKFRMNEVQGVGAAVTYYRRYLYMLILDLVESDGFDSQKPKDEDSDEDAPAPAPKAKAPATPAQRGKIKEELTDSEGEASELQIEGLKAALSKLLDTDPEQEEFVQNVVLMTEEFTKITKSQCEQLTNGVAEMLAAYETEE